MACDKKSQTQSTNAVSSDDEDSDGIMERPRSNSRIRTGPGMINPLLETISTIEDFCDSDESCDWPAGPSTTSNVSPVVHPPPHHHQESCSTDSDRDYIAYAGSNSIDSGYKSSCPTPDLVDGYYIHKQNACTSNSSNVAHHCLTGGLSKSRNMGKREKIPATKMASDDVKNENHVTIDLDHLTCLRQSLLKVIQRYEMTQSNSTVNDEITVKARPRSRSPQIRRKPNGAHRPRSSSASSRCSHLDDSRPDSLSSLLSSPHLDRSRRFFRRSVSPRQLTAGQRLHRGVNLSSISTAKPPAPSSSSTSTTTTSTSLSSSSSLFNQCVKECRVASVLTAAASRLHSTQHSNVHHQLPVQSNSTKTVRFSPDQDTDGLKNSLQTHSAAIHCKPILKENLTCKHNQHYHHQHQVPMSEQDIDTILYGSAERVSNPAEQEPVNNNNNSGLENTTDGATSSRFSRVARCMLEIIEDLQRQQQQQQQDPCEDGPQEILLNTALKNPSLPPKPSRCPVLQPPASGTTTTTTGRCTKITSRLPPIRKTIPAPPPPPPAREREISGSLLAGADYHVYEEIVYDLSHQKKSGTTLPTGVSTESSSSPSSPPPPLPCSPPPPPLPARPSRLQRHLPPKAKIIRPSPTWPEKKQQHIQLQSEPSHPLTVHPVKPWLSVIKPLRRDKSPKWSTTNNKFNPQVQRPNVRSNFYTFTGQSMKDRSVIHPEKTEMIEDEYGFRTVAHLV